LNNSIDNINIHDQKQIGNDIKQFNNNKNKKTSTEKETPEIILKLKTEITKINTHNKHKISVKNFWKFFLKNLNEFLLQNAEALLKEKNFIKEYKKELQKSFYDSNDQILFMNLIDGYVYSENPENKYKTLRYILDQIKLHDSDFIKVEEPSIESKAINNLINLEIEDFYKNIPTIKILYQYFSIGGSFLLMIGKKCTDKKDKKFFQKISQSENENSSLYLNFFYNFESYYLTDEAIKFDLFSTFIKILFSNLDRILKFQDKKYLNTIENTINAL
jgi:hypothetical protein